MPAEWHYHAEGVYFNERENEPGVNVMPEGYPQDKTPKFWMYHPEFVRAVRQGLSDLVKMEYFPADPDLLTLVGSAADSMSLINAAKVLDGVLRALGAGRNEGM